MHDVVADADTAAITRAIIALARSLGKTVIAEGVETTAQADFLREAGCTLLQGFHFGAPMPAAELERQRLCASADFLNAARDPSLVRDIAPHAKDLEGFLFPSTYQFARSASPEEMAATMVREFRTEWGKIQPTAQQNPPVAGIGADPAPTPLPAPASRLSPAESKLMSAEIACCDFGQSN